MKVGILSKTDERSVQVARSLVELAKKIRAGDRGREVGCRLAGLGGGKPLASG
ncbi:MAG: hypothetical protein QXR87_03980 [Candidatus Hadarchaeales archaeon]